jgi:hypothetical protein
LPSAERIVPGGAFRARGAVMGELGGHVLPGAPAVRAVLQDAAVVVGARVVVFEAVSVLEVQVGGFSGRHLHALGHQRAEVRTSRNVDADKVRHAAGGVRVLAVAVEPALGTHQGLHLPVAARSVLHVVEEQIGRRLTNCNRAGVIWSPTGASLRVKPPSGIRICSLSYGRMRSG